MENKKCTKCNTVKELKEFSKHKQSKDGLLHVCRLCSSNYQKEYFRTVKGLISRIYEHQKLSSKRRKHYLPNYNKSELIEWVGTQSNFKNLYEDWIISDYDSKLKPSIDRKDDYLPYTLDNIQLMTWEDNKKKSCLDRKNGINNKHSKSILQLTKDLVLVKEYYSISNAARESNVNRGNISSCCSNKSKSAGGFVWKYKNN